MVWGSMTDQERVKRAVDQVEEAHHGEGERERERTPESDPCQGQLFRLGRYSVLLRFHVKLDGCKYFLTPLGRSFRRSF